MERQLTSHDWLVSSTKVYIPLEMTGKCSSKSRTLMSTLQVATNTQNLVHLQKCLRAIITKQSATPKVTKMSHPGEVERITLSGLLSSLESTKVTFTRCPWTTLRAMEDTKTGRFGNSFPTQMLINYDLKPSYTSSWSPSTCQHL